VALVRDLPSLFHARIELRQIGARGRGEAASTAWPLRPPVLLLELAAELRR